MIILGIDPGSRVTGFGLIQIEGRKVKYLHSGALKLADGEDFFKRLKTIFNQGLTLAQSYNPDILALESLIYVKNVSSLAKLAQARGAILAGVLHHKEIPVCEYAPNLIKSSVTGFGHSPKESVGKALQLFLGKRDFKTTDESDALAIALCHFLHDTPAHNKMRSLTC
ncbi:MAG: crossover junction endodeoxyribonuclease RuvC [Bdellovibrionales bacterium GWA2_49_15]|nr:MAG: crossover junction endodeoxyribonuclease RuvC [Bdellovibrionales bacterium GWA2_49_15]